MKVRRRITKPEDFVDKTPAPAPRGITHLSQHHPSPPVPPPAGTFACFTLYVPDLLRMDDKTLAVEASMASEVSRAYFLERQRRNHEKGSPLFEMDARTRDYCLKRVHEYFIGHPRTL